MIRILPDKNPFKKIRVAFCYKNFKTHCISHIGLGVAAINTSKVLRRVGIHADVHPIIKGEDIDRLLHEAEDRKHPISHIIISAPWIPTHTLQHLCHKYPKVHFAVVCHSNVGFLQADTNGVKLFREYLELEMGVSNFHVAGNSKKFCRWVEKALGYKCSYLTNLYYLDHLVHPHQHGWHHNGGVLKIGAFGALRTQKNFMTAIAAAIQIARELKAETEVWISTERVDGPETERIFRSTKELIHGVPGITLKPAPWSSWPKFRKIVGHMHLLLQPSYTESFNMVTADGIAEGVPSAVGPAIDWVPKNWHCNPDDVCDIAHTGVRLIHDSHAAKEGLHCLKEHNKEGLHYWIRYLTHQSCGTEEFDTYSLNDSI